MSLLEKNSEKIPHKLINEGIFGHLNPFGVCCIAFIQ